MTDICDKNSQALEIIYSAIDEINMILPPEEMLEKSQNTLIFDRSGGLDSLSLTNFIVLIEQKIEETFGIAVTLVDAMLMAQENSPFRTASNLTDYITLLLEKESD